jgi:hypothetical protein
MLGDFILELVVAPGPNPTITLPNVAPAGRIPWSQRFTYRQPVYYIIDDTTKQEWGYGTYIPGSPNQITRDTVLGNSAGTTVRFNFTGVTRCYTGWPAIAQEAALGVNAGRNLFHNPLFNVAQRGAGPFTVAGYTLDRWLYATGTAGGSRSITQTVLSDLARVSIGDEEPANCLTDIFTGGTAAGDFDLIVQRIENVRRTAGRLVTISFWVIVNPVMNLGINWTQNFGAGGSAPVNGTAQVKSIGNSNWPRYSVTFAVPVVTGKTFGTAGTDFFEVDFWLSSGTTNNTVAGGIGVQSGSFDLWGMQCETAPIATPLERPDPRVDLAQCQRFFQSLGGVLISGYDTAGASIFTDFGLPTPMRAAPSAVFGTFAYSNASAVAMNATTATHMRPRVLATATGNGWGQGLIQLSADL